MFIFGLSQPTCAISLQIMRFILYPQESKQYPNTSGVFASEIYTAICVREASAIPRGVQVGGCAMSHFPRFVLQVTFIYSIMPHIFLYSRLRCMDQLELLERRVRQLNGEADIAAAVSSAQREFTRYGLS
jgi:hypothetical protein